MKIKDIFIESNELLANLVAVDQQERHNYSRFVQAKANGNYELGAKLYAQLKNRESDDIFGERERLSKFTKVKFDFNSFTEEDWANYWLLAQHCDFDRAFQKKALNIISMKFGPNHDYTQYLYDRIICGIVGQQKYNTQDICQKDEVLPLVDKVLKEYDLPKSSGIESLIAARELTLKKDDSADELFKNTKFNNGTSLVNWVLTDISDRASGHDSETLANFAAKLASQWNEASEEDKKLAVKLAQKYIDDFKKMEKDPSYKDEIRTESNLDEVAQQPPVALSDGQLYQIKLRLESFPTIPAGDDYISTRSLGIPVFQDVVRLPARFGQLLKKLKPELVPISQIETAQGYLIKSKILAILEADKPLPPVVLIRQDGKLILTDGNHRLAARILQNKSAILAVIAPAKE